jgi:alpha-L-fucosidase 2
MSFMRIPTSYLLMLASPLFAAYHGDIRYAPPLTSLMDLETPAGDGPFLTVVAVHGGGWSGGSRDDASAFCRAMAASGYACAAIDYRLAPAVRFGEQIEDVRAAIAFLMANAGKYRLMPGGVILAGESAGGQLVSWLGAQHPEGVPILGVIAFSAPCDLIALGEPGRALGVVPPEVRDLLGVSGWTAGDLEKMRRASPRFAIRPPDDVGGAPPFLVIHGQEDRVVPPQQSKDFCAELNRAGTMCETVPIPGARHGLWNEAAFARWQPEWNPEVNHWIARNFTHW